MAAQALYRKWRSQTFDEVIGQEHVTRTLRNALRDGRIAHAYLFSGPRGTGKTSTARLLAKAVNCLHEDVQARPDNTCAMCQAISAGAFLDLIEIDAASNRGIDEIRDLREKVHFAPTQGQYKVYVIDEVHMLTPEAFNALLKTLEEPPPHAIFVLATTEPHKIPDTVLSRCQRFDFRRIPTHEIVERLRHILHEEGRAAEPAALEMIARGAEGCMRDAISLTDQLLSYGSEVITEAQVQAVRGTISSQAIAQLVDCMATRDAPQGLALLNQLALQGVDLRQLTLQVVAHLRSVLLVCVGKQQGASILVDLSTEQMAAVQQQAEHFNVRFLSQSIRAWNQAAVEMRDAPDPHLTLELAWLDVIQLAASPTDARVLARSEIQPATSVTGLVSPASPPSIGSTSSLPAMQPGKPAEIGVPRVALPTDLSVASPALPRPATAIPDDEVVQVLRSNWTALLQAAETARGGSLRGALRTLRSVVAHGDDVYFSFENEFSRSTVDRLANKSVLQDLIGQLLGRPVRLHCQVGGAVIGGDPAQQSLAATPPALGAEQVADDPVVAHALQNLGAVTSNVTTRR
jgi:DNA polymerase-3 subunit gamma/tau